MPTKLTLTACLASTLFMTGVIVFVQVVHYPLFGLVEPRAFARYHEGHVRRTTTVVLVPMVVELATSLLLVLRRPEGTPAWLAWVGLGAAAVAWGVTGMLSVPLHDRLAQGFDPQAHMALVRSNGVRTAAWLVHSLVVLAMTVRCMR